ncbi:MAG: 50S ribosomal protein L24 [Deltaproteobacteria bacterium]|nr:50S ribosomal protein L24 [Deltaproteobacteria bacterium]
MSSKPKYKIRKDDVVVVVAGAQKGRTGRVVRLLPEKGKVVVEGVHMVRRHVRGTPEQPGRILEKEAPIAISNVALWNAETKTRVKPAWRIQEDGTRVRVDRRTGEPVARPSKA